MKILYMTHCCAQKDDTLKGSHIAVLPQQLYQEPYISNFMQTCLKAEVNWAIFSDLYGVWFPNIQHEWYDKHPDSVSEAAFKDLVQDFNTKLAPYNLIYFYFLPEHYHSFYDKIMAASAVKGKLIKFSTLGRVKK